jgi:hypothetical protein
MRIPRSALLIVGVLSALVSGGCTDSRVNPAPGDLATTQPGEAITMAKVVDEGGPIFRSLDIQLTAPSGVLAEYWTVNTPHLVTASDSDIKTTHTLPLLRLRANATYNYQVKTLQGGQPGAVVASGTFTTGALPADLASIPFTVQGTATSPLTFLSLNTMFNGGVVVDSDGYVVWYGRLPSGIAQGVTKRMNGNWALIAEGVGIYEFTPLGRIAASLPQSMQFGLMHHDVVATPQNTLLFLTMENKVFNGTSLSGEGIWEWNPATGDLTRRWLAFDFFDPANDKGTRSEATDWFHANSLSLGPRGNVVVSSQIMDQVFSLTSDFTAIEWRLGGPGSTINLLPEQETSGQHSAAEVAPYEVLVFDNGFDGAKGKYSRAYQRKFDPVSKTVISTWEYRPTPDNWARIVSSARRLANGNTVITFGPSKNVLGIGATGPVAVHEVNSAGALVWNMTIGIPNEGGNHVFRGEPIESIGGEKVVQ